MLGLCPWRLSKDYINPILIIAEEVLVCVLAKALLGQPLQALHKMWWVLLPFVLLMGTANWGCFLQEHTNNLYCFQSSCEWVRASGLNVLLFWAPFLITSWGFLLPFWHRQLFLHWVSYVLSSLGVVTFSILLLFFPLKFKEVQYLHKQLACFFTAFWHNLFRMPFWK